MTKKIPLCKAFTLMDLEVLFRGQSQEMCCCCVDATYTSQMQSLILWNINKCGTPSEAIWISSRHVLTEGCCVFIICCSFTAYSDLPFTNTAQLERLFHCLRSYGVQLDKAHRLQVSLYLLFVCLFLISRKLLTAIWPVPNNCLVVNNPPNFVHFYTKKTSPALVE